VDKHVKCRSNLQKVNQLDARIVLEKVDHQEAAEAEDSAEEVISADQEEASTTGLEKCIKQFVPNVSKNVKYHSNLQKVNQFIAKIVSKTEETIKKNSSFLLE
jgi:hypothetical protein